MELILFARTFCTSFRRTVNQLLHRAGAPLIFGLAGWAGLQLEWSLHVLVTGMLTGVLLPLGLVFGIPTLEPFKKTAWGLIAVGNGLSGVSILLRLSAGAQQLPTLTASDVLTVLAFSSSIIGLGLLFRFMRGKEARLQTLDCVAVGGVLAIGLWSFVLRPLSDPDQLTGLRFTLEALSPMLSTVLLCTALALAYQAPSGVYRQTCGMLALGAALALGHDLGAFVGGLQGWTYTETGLPFIAGVAFAANGVAAGIRIWRGRALPPRKPVGVKSGAAAFGFVVFAATAIWIAETALTGQPHLLTSLGCIGLFVCSAIRLLVSARENQELSESILRLNLELEQEVSEQCRMLLDTQRLVATVHGPDSPDTVLADMSLWYAECMAVDRIEIEAHLGSTHRAVYGQLPPPHLPPEHRWETTLFWRDRPLGSVRLFRFTHPFDAVDQMTLGTAAAQLAAALDNNRLYRQALNAALTDPLTGLWNHRAIHQELDAMLDEVRADDASLGLLRLDLDNFRLFNANYGNIEGDRILIQIAHALREALRPGDVIGRTGADEFLVLITDCSPEEALATAHRLRKIAVEAGTVKDGDRVIANSVSIGVAHYPRDAQDLVELIAIADANLSSARFDPAGVVMLSAEEVAFRANVNVASLGVVDAMVNAIDARDAYTKRHSEEVVTYALWAAEELGLDEETRGEIRLAGLLHDVGKIGVPDAILRKPGRLSDEEFEAMAKHPEIGAIIVRALNVSDDVYAGVRHHHEHYDGKGYPDALAGEAIPFFGRLLAVADAFSAMTSDRPYRRGMPWGKAVSLIEQGLGTQFDPFIGAAFCRTVRNRHPERFEAELEAA